MDLAPVINDIGLKPIPVKLSLRKGKASGKGLGNFDLAVGSVGQWYFRSKNHGERPSLDELKSFSDKNLNLIEELLKIEGTNMLYHRENEYSKDKGTIKVFRKNNGKQIKGAIEYDGSKTRLIFENEDVFDYKKHPKAARLLDGKFHDINEWLLATHDTEFPLASDQVARLFRNPNSCDIMTSTLGEIVYNFEHGVTKNDHLYSHDLLKSTKVPLVIGGTNMDSKKLEVCKISDLVPTVVKLLDGKIDKHVVGTPLI